MSYYVYILASATNYSIYIGVTNDLIRRVYEHKIHADPKSFTSQYNVHKLVYFEQTSDVGEPWREKNNSKAGGVRRRMH